jgi:hypothetical protein
MPIWHSFFQTMVQYKDCLSEDFCIGEEQLGSSILTLYESLARVCLWREWLHRLPQIWKVLQLRLWANCTPSSWMSSYFLKGNMSSTFSCLLPTCRLLCGFNFLRKGVWAEECIIWHLHLKRVIFLCIKSVFHGCNKIPEINTGRKDLFWLIVSGVSLHGHLAPLLLHLWWGRTSWQNAVNGAVHLMDAKKQRWGSAPGQNIHFRVIPASDLLPVRLVHIFPVYHRPAAPWCYWFLQCCS